MRPVFLSKHNSCGKFALAVAGLLAAICAGVVMLTLSACSGTGAQLKIVTPYGVYDTTTSGTTVLDTRPLFGAMPPPIDYSRYPTPQLEK